MFVGLGIAEMGQHSVAHILGDKTAIALDHFAGCNDRALRNADGRACKEAVEDDPRGERRAA
jgi:hypothetical protein